jgi:hypothetical protein
VKNKNILKWINKTTYVDIDTGETLGPKEIPQYYIVKTKKYVTQPKRTSSTRIVERINECRRKPEQAELW